MRELMPCPFCGRAPVSHDFFYEDEGYWSIECPNRAGKDGHFAGVHGETVSAAITAWNRRPQQITAETVRRVLDAMGGLIGSGTKPDDWLNHEAIAHRANQQEEK